TMALEAAKVLDKLGVGYAVLHGGLPGKDRKDVLERFKTDPACKVFLSTDAGGTGLNLQNADTVVNLELPWNPAVLEQRIGRVHRMGQSRGVQVLNFVGQGSIEEGMLSVLAFKKSLFAGVLDGGEREVFLQGTRLSQFMKSVEQVAGAMGEADADPAAEPPVAADAGATPSNAVEASQAGDGVAVFAQSAATAEPRPAPAPAADGQPPRMESADPWAAILEAGAALLQGLATPRAAGGAAPAAAPVTIERDPVTGQASVRLPLPDAAVLQRLAKAFEPWLR
ncbi:MAG TPA: C-terminal helicase domain-containing protein, partial [Rhizobacter sp.]|nr:C-terminal helicase domain-containing protein [Rhizobacter sp.]